MSLFIYLHIIIYACRCTLCGERGGEWCLLAWVRVRSYDFSLFLFFFFLFIQFAYLVHRSEPVGLVGQQPACSVSGGKPVPVECLFRGNPAVVPDGRTRGVHRICVVDQRGQLFGCWDQQWRGSGELWGMNFSFAVCFFYIPQLELGSRVYNTG